MKKNLFLLFFPILLIISVSLTSCKKNPDVSSFSEYTQNLFLHQISGNTLNLHYTLADPASYGITDYPVTLGSISSEDLLLAKSSMENISYQLLNFNYNELTTEEKLTYDILIDYINTENTSINLCLYYEPLNPDSGIQCELPVLLAEYAFRREQDISDYLILLTQIPEYFSDIAGYEQEKSDAGLFMSDSMLAEITSQCQSICSSQEDCFLIQTFDSRLDEFPGMNNTTKESYKAKNKELILKVVLPAYETLADNLSSLAETGKNDAGLSHFPEGKSYYEYLVKSSTGSSDSVPSLMKRISEKRKEHLSEISSLITKDPTLTEASSNCSIAFADPETILDQLKHAMNQDFPAPPDTNFSVKYVDSSMKDFLAPAFYLTTPMDDTSNNSIYINPGCSYDNLKLFTTLAHEGYPGHLYQNLMSSSYGTVPICEMLAYPGFTEGWATYVEMRSFHYAGLDENLARVLELNQSTTLSLYASLDIGIHYEGWSAADTAAFLAAYGISSTETALEIYHAILYNPANYLKYYVGYLEFLDLEEYWKESYGTDYNASDFHAAILKIGPAPFDLVKKYLPVYYESSN